MEKKPTIRKSTAPAVPVAAVTKAPIEVPERPVPPSHKDIAAQAVRIWREKGCPKACDVEIWLEAERQLTGKAASPSHKDVAVQTVKIWREKGCPKACDDRIWLEAERKIVDQQQQRFERIAMGHKRPVSEFNADNLMQELDELFPSPAGQGVTTAL
jgi:hypothetical protein